MKRVFGIGTLTVDDPAPLGSLQDAFELLVQRFPQLRHSAVFESDGVVVDEQTVRYAIPLVPAKTNG
jgi:hypothetical protein